MKRLILLTFLCCFSVTAFCQNIILKYGTEATYALTRSSDKKFTLTLVSTKEIKKDIGLSNDFLKADVDSTQIKFVFGGMKKNDRTKVFLIMKTGLKGMVKYSAKIKSPGANGFVATNVNMIIGNVKTVEMWQNEIAEIMLSDFEEGKP